MKLTMEQQAQHAFAMAEKAVKQLGWPYEIDKSEPYVLETAVKGEDEITVSMILRVREEDEMLMVTSVLDLEITDETKDDLLLALTIINNASAVGNFEYHEENRSVWFRISTYICGCELSMNAAGYFFYAAARCVDEYNDKLLMLTNGLMTIDEFYQAVNK